MNTGYEISPDYSFVYNCPISPIIFFLILYSCLIFHTLIDIIWVLYFLNSLVCAVDLYAFVLYNTILITVALYYCLKYKKSMILLSVFHTHDGFGYSESFASPQVLGVFILVM